MQIELKSLQHTLGITFLYVTHDQEEALVMSDRIGIMNRGKLEQLDTPGNIYHHPANRFVASFIGVSNILVGQIASAGPSGVTVETDGGETVVAGTGPMRSGERVSVLIRPEKIDIQTTGSGDNRPWLSARIEQIVFVGSELQVHAALSNGSGSSPGTAARGERKLVARAGRAARL
jgi:spermidine/putrescine transport system ATP-binding protein